MPKRKETTTDVGELITRSINLVMDAGHPDRVAHYRPTRKSVRALSAILDPSVSDALMVSAPYGTGKSLLGTYALHVVENTDSAKKVLDPVVSRLLRVDESLGRVVERRAKSEESGLVLTVHGGHESVPEVIAEAAAAALRRLGFRTQAGGLLRRKRRSIDDALTILDAVKRLAIDRGFDRVVILWDEFGLHLEQLALSGRPAQLLDVQVLAEYVSRSQDLPMKLAVFLHKGVLNYASSLPEATRREWSKIEGRFERIEYVDDSEEVYELIAELVRSQSKETSGSPSKLLADYCKRIQDEGLFDGVSAKRLPLLVSRALPLHPLALFVLPQVTARIAQNERTVFEFVRTLNADEPIGLVEMFEYFEPAMSTDLAPGGTYRTWLEAKSALSKVVDQEEARVVCTAVLLSLAFSGGTRRLTRRLLVTALGACDGQCSATGPAAVDRLTGRRLLLHRRHSDEISLWHGTDVDLRKRLGEVKTSLRSGFDLAEFLSTNCPPPVWRPTQFNDEYQMRRFFRSRYRGMESPQAHLPDEALLESSDGLVVYLLAASPEDLARARKVATENPESRVVYALPRSEVPSLFDLALEVWAIMQMQLDSDLVSADPLVGEELRHMEDDARGHLVQLLDSMTMPGPGLEWFVERDPAEPRTKGELRRLLSNLCVRLYPQTPRINNEVINRFRPSAVIVNSRKKLVARVLEGQGDPNLGFDDPTIQYETGTAVTTMYRTVLLHTGIYRNVSNRWRFAKPHEIADKGLSEVWGRVRRFLDSSRKERHSFQDLIHALVGPPYGMRPGVLPIIIGAALTSHPYHFIYCDGKYVDDLRPSDVEEICSSSSKYSVQTWRPNAKEKEWLMSVATAFGLEDLDSLHGPLERAVEAVQMWCTSLDKASVKSARLSPPAFKLRAALLSLHDPLRLLKREMPELLGGEKFSIGSVRRLVELLEEIRGVSEKYYDEAKAIMISVVGSQEENRDTRQVLRNWASCFTNAFLDDYSGPPGRSLLLATRREYANERSFIGAVGAALHRGLPYWTDADVGVFRDVFRRTVWSLESELIRHYRDDARTEKAPLLDRKLAELISEYRRLLGDSKAEERVRELIQNQTAGVV